MLNFLRKFLSRRIVNIYHLVVAVLANIIYGFPSRQLHVIGVTGTDGKTTTTNMIANVLKAGGFPVSFLSSINAEIGDKHFDTGLHTTTPSPFALQKLFSKMLQAGSRYAVIETTSHALDQHRVWGVDFETAVITNVTPEHLDYHRTYEEYLLAKAKLFAKVSQNPHSTFVLNAQDKSYEVLRQFPAKQVFLYNNRGSLYATDIVDTLENISFLAHTPKGNLQIDLKISGQFNISNALAAISVALAYNISLERIKQGLEAVRGVSGRMEFIHAGQNFPVVVDFAHTPNAIHALLSSVRPKISGKIILVFGSAGERDTKKRPLMGEAASKHADIVIITREDNRSEKVDSICEQIASGIKEKTLGKSLFIIPDRKDAIRLALQTAQANDLVVLAGKGHEQSLNVDGTEIPWDDRAVVREQINSLGLKSKS